MGSYQSPSITDSSNNNEVFDVGKSRCLVEWFAFASPCSFLTIASCELAFVNLDDLDATFLQALHPFLQLLYPFLLINYIHRGTCS